VSDPRAAPINYAGRGWPVLPVQSLNARGSCCCGRSDCPSPGKHPIGKLVPHGLKQASIDSERLQQWWEQYPRANIGIVTGAASGFFALDVDPRHGGEESLEALLAQWGNLPETVEQLTGGGGRHLLFKHPGLPVPCGNGKLGQGIDIKGDGGYIVVDPSVHASGQQYAWELSHHPDDTQIADAPQWLLDRVVKPNGSTATTSPSGETFHFDPSRQQEVAIAKAALAALKPGRADSYDPWIKVGMIVHSIDSGAAMLDEYEKWSAQSDKYVPGECAKKWATFRRDQALGLPTLIRWANKDTGGKFRFDDRPVKPKRQQRRAAGVSHKPFPVDALPEPIRQLAVSGAIALGCDPSYIALPALGAAASVIGNARTICLKASWSEPCVLWVVIIGDPGSVKSPAIDLALQPVRRLQREALDRYEEELRRYEMEKTKHEATLADWRKKKEASRDDPPEPPARPQPQRFIVSDITTEALAEVLGTSPRGVGLFRDELAAFFRSFDAYKGGRGADCQAYLEMHRAGYLVVDRKTGQKKTLQVERAAVSIMGSIQPGTFRRTLHREFFENGLVSRLLLTMPPRQQKQWTEKSIDAAVLNRYDMLFDGLLALEPQPSDEGRFLPIEVSLTAEAKKLFADFYNDLAIKQAEADEDVASALAKLEGYCARLALVIHLVRHEDGDRTLTTPDAVDEASLAAAIRLTHWFAAEAERVYAVLRETEEDGVRRRLIELIQRRGGRITANDLRRFSTTYRDSAEAANEALEELARQGSGQWEPVPPGPKGGRPTRIFVLDRPPSKEPDPEQRAGLSSVDSSRTDEDDRGEVVL